MQQLIILIVALALAGGVYLFLTISKKKNKEQTEENAVEMMTANKMINVKDIRNNCLHTNDGYTVTFIEIGGMSMELFSESEKLAYCKNITSIVSRFQFPYKYMAISSPYVIKHMVTADSNRLALGGTADTALMELLKRKPNIRNICLCLDNDSAGRAASATIRQKLMSMGYMNVYERFSREKDYNEELMMVRKTEIEISYE